VITLTEIKKYNACRSGVERFELAFPDGMAEEGDLIQFYTDKGDCGYMSYMEDLIWFVFHRHPGFFDYAIIPLIKDAWPTYAHLFTIPMTAEKVTKSLSGLEELYGEEGSVKVILENFQENGHWTFLAVSEADDLLKYESEYEDYELIFPLACTWLKARGNPCAKNV
jgi:hypothetical protein